jgi:spore germination protein KB
MIILFQIGSSPLFYLASQAGSDAWISVLIGMLCGMLLLLAVTLPIHRRLPDKDLVGILHYAFGKWMGSVFGMAYFLYFCYQAIRNVREFGDLVIMYLLPQTPLMVIMFVFLTVAGYAVFKGIEIFARVTEILLPIMIVIYVTMFIFICFSGFFDLERLQPVFNNGFKKIASTAVPGLISFPFGEMVLFLMFWKYAGPSSNTTKVTLISFLFTGLFISLTDIMIFASLGTLSEFCIVPLLQVLNLLSISDFIERMDPIVALLLFGGVFIKMTAYFFGATLLFSQLFKLNRPVAMVPVGAVLFSGSMAFRSYMQHIWVGFELNVKYHFPIFQIYFPMFLLLVMMVRSLIQGKKSAAS